MQLRRSGAIARRHLGSPAEADGRWRGVSREAEPVRLGVHHRHTRSLCDESPAESAQRRDDFVAADQSGSVPNLSDAAGNRARENALLTASGLSCMSPAPQLKREQSPRAIFYPATRQLSCVLKYIARTLLKLSFLSSSPTTPAMQSVSVGGKGARSGARCGLQLDGRDDRSILRVRPALLLGIASGAKRRWAIIRRSIPILRSNFF